MDRSSRIIFAASLALFVAVRLAIVLTAPDRIRHVSPEEYQYALYADSLLNGIEPGYEFTHLTGQKWTSYLMAGLMTAGLRPAAAIRLIPLFVSALGFACLLYFILKQAGPVAGAVFGLMMVFPHLPYLKWSLTLWGGYPEASFLIAIPILVAYLGLETKKDWVILCAGLLLGIVFDFSMSILYILPAIFLMPVAASPAKQRLRPLALLSAGILLGVTPILWRLATGMWREFFETALAIKDKPMTAGVALSSPRLDNWRNLFFGKVGHDSAMSAIVLALSIAAMCWLIYSTSRRVLDKPNQAWRLIFPLSVLCFLAMIPFFSFFSFLHLRHVLWLFTCAYASMALALADLSRHWRRRTGAPIWVLPIIAGGLLAAVHATQILPLIRPSTPLMLARFRGLSYHRIGLQIVTGDEIGRINCLLDSAKLFGRDREFNRGFAQGFQAIENQSVFIKSGASADQVLRMGDVWMTNGASAPWLEGMGCALAVKEAGDMRAPAASFGLEARKLCAEILSECERKVMAR